MAYRQGLLLGLGVALGRGRNSSVVMIVAGETVAYGLAPD